MAIYIKNFQTQANYEQFTESSEYVTPNVSVILEDNTIYYNKLPNTPVPAGSIAYYVDGKIKTIHYNNWSPSLGTPVGVITIPEGFAPDGKARMISLSGQTATTWGGYGVDTLLPNYTKVPTTNNVGVINNGSADLAYLPSDKFNGTASYVDPISRYADTKKAMIPSPYDTQNNENKSNPVYYETIDGNNMLSDFNGLNNTLSLMNISNEYEAVNNCINYNDGLNSQVKIQWYLPAMGELGYIMPRFNEINKGLKAVNALELPSSGGLWSSSEHSANYACYLAMTNGSVLNNYKTFKLYSRPWAIL